MKRAYVDPTNQMYGRLYVTGSTSKPDGKHILYECICSCPDRNVVHVQKGHLLRGTSLSCGCLRKEIATARNKALFTKHASVGTPEYHSWDSMIQRCYNSNNPAYMRYGGRGITVCNRWLRSFEDFFADMGPRPEPNHLYSLDRYPDNNGQYEKTNCRWATKKQQGINRGIRLTNTSGFTGVYKHGHRWRAKITIDGETWHIGLYNTANAAYTAYCAVYKLHYSEEPPLH